MNRYRYCNCNTQRAINAVRITILDKITLAPIRTINFPAIDKQLIHFVGNHKPETLIISSIDQETGEERVLNTNKFMLEYSMTEDEYDSNQRLLKLRTYIREYVANIIHEGKITTIEAAQTAMNDMLLDIIQNMTADELQTYNNDLKTYNVDMWQVAWHMNLLSIADEF